MSLATAGTDEGRRTSRVAVVSPDIKQDLSSVAVVETDVVWLMFANVSRL